MSVLRKFISEGNERLNIPAASHDLDDEAFLSSVLGSGHIEVRSGPTDGLSAFCVGNSEYSGGEVVGRPRKGPVERIENPRTNFEFQSISTRPASKRRRSHQ